MTKAPYSRRSDLEKVTANWNKTLGLFARREYSLSILRAAVTMELALNYAIRQELHARRALPARFVDRLLKWANGIDGKLNKLLLPILLGTATHKRAKNIAKSLTSLNKDRNAIAHRGEFRAKGSAQEQLRFARTQILTLVGPYDRSFTLKEFNPSATHEISIMIPGGPMVQMPAHPSMRIEPLTDKQLLQGTAAQRRSAPLLAAPEQRRSATSDHELRCLATSAQA